MKKLLKFIIIILGMSLVSLGTALAIEKPIKIGCVTTLSGPYASVGEDLKAGIELAIEEINSSGGVLGQKLIVIFEDDTVKPSVAATKTEKLILQDKVNFITGTVSSGCTLAMMKVVEKYKVPMIVSVSESAKITREEKNKYTFRLPAHVFMTNPLLAKWFIENVGPKIYLFAADYDWGWDSNNAYKEGATKSGGQIVGEAFFPVGTKDFAPYFAKIKMSNPDALLLTAGGNDAISLLTQLKEFGLSKSIKIGGAGTIVVETNFPALGQSAEGFMAVDFYAESLDNPANKKFVTDYRKRFGRGPTKYSILSYEGIYWLAQIIQKVGSIEDVDKLIAALEGSSFKGPQGAKVMDKSSHQALLPIYLITIKDSKRVLVNEMKY